MRASGCASVSKRKREGGRERGRLFTNGLIDFPFESLGEFFWSGEVGRRNRQDKKKRKKKKGGVSRKEKTKGAGGTPPPPQTSVAFSRGAQMLVTRRRKQ